MQYVTPWLDTWMVTAQQIHCCRWWWYLTLEHRQNLHCEHVMGEEMSTVEMMMMTMTMMMMMSKCCGMKPQVICRPGNDVISQWSPDKISRCEYVMGEEMNTVEMMMMMMTMMMMMMMMMTMILMMSKCCISLQPQLLCKPDYNVISDWSPDRIWQGNWAPRYNEMRNSRHRMVWRQWAPPPCWCLHHVSAVGRQVAWWLARTICGWCESVCCPPPPAPSSIDTLMQYLSPSANEDRACRYKCSIAVAMFPFILPHTLRRSSIKVVRVSRSPLCMCLLFLPQVSWRAIAPGTFL